MSDHPEGRDTPEPPERHDSDTTGSASVPRTEPLDGPDSDAGSTSLTGPRPEAPAASPTGPSVSSPAEAPGAPDSDARSASPTGPRPETPGASSTEPPSPSRPGAPGAADSAGRRSAPFAGFGSVSGPSVASPRQPNPSHAGNSTVNHHLDDQGPEGLDSDELALRRMLHQAVQEMEPRDGTLDQLRRAVPARRARKRQAAVGMAAAALFVGTAVPAVLHVSGAGGSDANPSIAGQASQAQGGASQGKGPDGGSSGKAGDSSGTTGEQDQGGATDTGQTKGTDSTGAGSGTDPDATSAASAPACTPAQLGSGGSTVAVPDAGGVVYGSFRVSNISTTGCTVGGAVSLTTAALGAADATKISVVTHASGDAAAALPDPSLYVGPYLLAPGSAYDVKFAFVPSETCPSTGGTTGGGTGGASSPSPSPSEPVSTTGDTGTGTTAQFFTEDGPADGSVVVTHTAEGGGPSVSATVPGACAGTVYRTGVLASS